MVLRRVGDWIKIRYRFKYKVERNPSNDLYQMERNSKDQKMNKILLMFLRAT